MAPKRRPRESSSESDTSASDTPSPPPKATKASSGKRQRSSPFDPEPAWAQKDTAGAVTPGRVRELRKGLRRKGPVVYWMSRDQRSKDNWALIYAVQKVQLCSTEFTPFRPPLPALLHSHQARERGEAVAVVFNLVDSFLGANARHFAFMLRGLREVQPALAALGIPFFLFQVGLTGVHEVDAHNVVPIWAASDKLEYAARTLRTKIHRKLPEYLVEYPRLEPGCAVEWTGEKPSPVDWDSLIAAVIRAGPEVPEVDWIVPGEAAAAAGLQTFLEKRLRGYDSGRNDPSKGPTTLSGLSPWLHYGQIAPQRCALEARKLRKQHSKSVDAFLEELVVRRELADNFCFHQPQYDLLGGAWEWAQQSLEAHRGDKREFVYTAAQWEAAKTHDQLWNAAQLELVHYGKMHGFMRMYWAKKILEWSESPEEALRIAIEQNDKYSLDGRDPNGYVGCMWSIAGVHDQ
ncbi:unnamed protein product, partial [Closterium sp. Yama58-4]